ncbi:MAG: ImmA/IrrE family metallo-endopeptidase [Chloroflexi bacterium]|nr:ImmA/IrrE family metallo-endopeptidase [Chloroflexota bacterium]
MTALFVLELAAEFWRLAGGAGAAPRDLSGAVAMALELGVVQLSDLRLSRVDGWLRQRGVDWSAGARDRALRAALVAHAGHGLVFLEGTDPEPRRRFSLAHETAHYLVDYWRPRQEAAARLGPAALEVLDGRRPPTARERADALLAHVALGAHVHLMERTDTGHPAGATIDEAETLADGLALELLAPAVEAGPIACQAASEREAGEQLAARFGLPFAVARRHAAALRPPIRPNRDFLSRLGLEPPDLTSRFGPGARKGEWW